VPRPTDPGITKFGPLLGWCALACILAPGLETLPAAAAPVAPSASAAPLLLEPKDRVLVQRSYWPFEGRRRLYACSVGSPAGIHYAYDFETGAILSMWRGPFLDPSEMWVGRGNNQMGKPAAPALTLDGEPRFALFPGPATQMPKTGAWPDRPDALYSSQGYELEPNGQPIFLATWGTLTIRDRIAPAADGRGLTRTLRLAGQVPFQQGWLLVAEADTISRRPEGGYGVAGRGYRIEWPADSPHRPVVLSSSKVQRLALHLTKETLDQPVVYTLAW